jgi:membrane protease YdiL (CAAX protease family)
MSLKNKLSAIAGFLALFLIYHFPEFFQSIWIAAVFKIGFLFVAFVICRLQGWKGLEGYGLVFSNHWYRTLLAGLLTGIIAYILSLVCAIGYGFEHLQHSPSMFFLISTLPLTLVMTFFPSIAEDILTRGYLFGHLKNIRPIIWILFSSALYVLNHIRRLSDGTAVLGYLFLLGLVLAISVRAKKSLWLALGIHWGANIAFELVNAGVPLTVTTNQKASTWCLAIVWALVAVILGLLYRRELKATWGDFTFHM